MKVRKTSTTSSSGCENLKKLATAGVLLALTACGGGGGQDDTELDLSELRDLPDSIGAATDGEINAAADVAEVSAGKSVNIGILNNDNVGAGAQFQLVGQPANGTAVLLDSGEVSYTADSDFEGTDSVDYVLVDANGNQSRGTIFIAVACADCLVENATPVATTNSEGFAFCKDASTADPDGDGYGWEDNQTCVPATGAALPPLAANSDSVTLKAGATTAVSAMRNDSIADRSSVQFAIDVQPSEGKIEAASAGVVVYTAPSNFTGTDSLVYSLTDTSGNTSVANIDFNVECPDCVNYKGLRLSWPANPANENVESYRVFFGPDENTHTATMLSEVRSSDLGGSAPNAVYDLANDLNLSGNEGGCFRVTAVRGSEESEPSDPICFNLG